jgi:hypothetical protein
MLTASGFVDTDRVALEYGLERNDMTLRSRRESRKGVYG